MKHPPKVVAIVLNWNNYEDTAACLRSIASVEYPNLDVLVVDNGSSDGSGRCIDDEFATVTVHYNDRNEGFAGGMNPGIRRALDGGADYVWLLNNDVQFPEADVLSRLVETMAEEPDIGVLTPLVYEYPDTDAVWFWRGTIDWRAANADHADVPETLPHGVVETDYVPNCCSLFRASVFSDIGLLPERYFIYYEDVEHGVRIRDGGYRLATDMRTVVYHEQGGTSGDELQPLFSYYNARNLFLFACAFSDRVDSLFPVYASVWIVKQVGYRGLNGAFTGIVPFLRGVLDGVLGWDERGPYP